MIRVVPVVVLLVFLVSRARGAQGRMPGLPGRERRTNATFTRRATRAERAGDRPRSWHWRPGWQRGLIRLAVILPPAMLAWGLLAHRAGTLWALAIPAAIGIRYAG